MSPSNRPPTVSAVDSDTKESVLDSVRIELLTEAQRSPGLLADLANLERYIAETYSARSFIELLQNADDAKASRFLIAQEGDWLFCANAGERFSRNDFYSLCRSAFSDKTRGQSIGYRGIGFKSVVGMANEVHLLSGALRATFSRQLFCRGEPSTARRVTTRSPAGRRTTQSMPGGATTRWMVQPARTR